MTKGIYLFAQDVLDETVNVVLDRLERVGLNGVNLAAAYHHSRDVFPHNPRRRVAYLEGGTVYFRPDVERYPDRRLVPRIAAIARDSDPLALLCDAAEHRGFKVSAWLVVLHNTRLAFAAPDCAPLTALGDPLLNGLCPAHPAVRAYAESLAADVGRYELESIKLESLSYMPFDHGYHHERSFVRLSPNIRFLFGLCFCPHCLAYAQSQSIDAERVRTWVAASLEAVLESADNESHETHLEEARIRDACDGELGRFLDARSAVVTSLAAQVSAAVRTVSPSTRVVFLDAAGARLGYATGRPATEQAAAAVGWRDGVDVEALGKCCDRVGMLGYFADVDRLAHEIRAYQSLLPGAGRLEVVVRPMPPDSQSATDLATKVLALWNQGIEEVDFYHYGLMRLEALDWIRSALRAAGYL
jgi:hypothetical protein